jgi:type II secretory pathway pseudopilin PulG
MHRQRGISLGEVALTTTVIGGLTFAALPKLNEAKVRAKESALRYELQTIRKAVDTFNAETSGWPLVVSDLLGEKPPASFVYKGKEVAWGNRRWNGPYLGYGEKGKEFIPKDPVSGEPFRQSRTETGRLQVFSSAKGKDIDGTDFSTF